MTTWNIAIDLNEDGSVDFKMSPSEALILQGVFANLKGGMAIPVIDLPAGVLTFKPALKIIPASVVPEFIVMERPEDFVRRSVRGDRKQWHRYNPNTPETDVPTTYCGFNMHTAEHADFVPPTADRCKHCEKGHQKWLSQRR